MKKQKICNNCKNKSKYLEPIAPGECMLCMWCKELKMKVEPNQTCPKFESED